MRKIKIEVRKNMGSGLYTAYVNGVIVDDCSTKREAIKSAKRYIKNNFTTQPIVHTEEIALAD